jgi:hypothetical protein
VGRLRKPRRKRKASSFFLSRSGDMRRIFIIGLISKKVDRLLYRGAVGKFNGKRDYVRENLKPIIDFSLLRLWDGT